MNCIVAVNALLLLRLTGANPVGNFTANATVIIDSVVNVSSSDPVHPYCLNTVINSPSIFDLHTDLGTAIDMLELACTNTTFKRNVSNKIVTAFKYTYHIVYLFMFACSLHSGMLNLNWTRMNIIKMMPLMLHSSTTWQLTVKWKQFVKMKRRSFTEEKAP